MWCFIQFYSVFVYLCLGLGLLVHNSFFKIDMDMSHTFRPNEHLTDILGPEMYHWQLDWDELYTLTPTASVNRSQRVLKIKFYPKFSGGSGGGWLGWVLWVTATFR